MSINNNYLNFFVNTSKLEEDQYTNLFNLAVWPEEPPVILVFEKMLAFRKNVVPCFPNEYAVLPETSLESTVLDELGGNEAQ